MGRPALDGCGCWSWLVLGNYEDGPASASGLWILYAIRILFYIDSRYLSVMEVVLLAFPSHDNQV